MAAALAGAARASQAAATGVRPEPVSEGPEPAFLGFEPSYPGDLYACAFALRLRGVSGEAEGGAAQIELEARQVDWARRLAGGLFTPTGGRLLEVRYLASSSREPTARTMVTLYLVALGFGEDREAAERAARALWSDVESLTRLGQALYQFWPVESPEDLRFVLRPLEPHSIVEIAASAGRLLVEPEPIDPVGFQGAARVPGKPAVLDLPLPMSGPSRPLRPLLEVLAAQKTPLQLSIRLEPRVLSPEERSLLDEVRQKLAGGRGDPWRIEYQDGSVKALPGELETTEDAMIALLGSLGHHFRVRCFLEAPRPIPRPLQTIAADVLIGGDARGWIIEQLEDPEKETVRNAWGIRNEPQRTLSRCDDELVKDFWKQALAVGGEHSLNNMAPYITSKLNQFVYNDILRPIIRQRRSSIDFRAVMDEGKILLVNLAKGYAGEMSSALVGMVLVARIMAAAMSRHDTPREQRHPHYLYVDEFQRFTSRTVPQMLAEVRKYGLGLILANQNLQQLSEPTVHAVLGNVGTMLFFRPGPPDVERIRPYVDPTFSKTDLLGLPNFAIVGRLLADDAPTAPFLFNTAWRPPRF